MVLSFFRANGTSPRLRILQACQLLVALTSVIFVVMAPFTPSHLRRFVFSLLYSLLFTAFTTTGFVLAEHQAAVSGDLTKTKYGAYQLYKVLTAGVIYVLGFIIFVKTRFTPTQGKSIWVDDLLHGRFPFHTSILVLHLFNWIFLFAGLTYSCVMSDIKQEGQIRLAGDEAQIALEPEQLVDGSRDNDDAVARALQAQETAWQT